MGFSDQKALMKSEQITKLGQGNAVNNCNKSHEN